MADNWYSSNDDLYDYDTIEEEREDIGQAFDDGMQYLFNILFTGSKGDGQTGIALHYLNENATNIDTLYEESNKKVYEEEPFAKLAGHCVLQREVPDETTQKQVYMGYIKIPRKEFIDNNIPFDDSDLPVLEKAVFRYMDMTLFIHRVKGVTHVADRFLFYHFEVSQKEYR